MGTEPMGLVRDQASFPGLGERNPLLQHRGRAVAGHGCNRSAFARAQEVAWLASLRVAKPFAREGSHWQATTKGRLQQDRGPATLL